MIKLFEEGNDMINSLNCIVKITSETPKGGMVRELAAQDLTFALERLGLNGKISAMAADVRNTLGAVAGVGDATETERELRLMLIKVRDFLQCLDEPLG